MPSIIYKEKKSNFIYFETLLNEINENGLQDRLQQKVKNYKDSRIATGDQCIHSGIIHCKCTFWPIHVL